jgi:hypothetical protein
MPADYKLVVFAGYIPLDVTLTSCRGKAGWREKYGIREWLPERDLFCATYLGKHR